MSTAEHKSESLLMTQGEAARLLGVSRNTVVRLVERGVLPTMRLAPGMAPLVRRADVVALADGQEGSP
jgi:excisionase family DNA binding protein